MRKVWPGILFILILVIVAVFGGTKLDGLFMARRTGKTERLYRVSRVIDGDTIVVDDQIIVRYIGINSPETKDPRKPVECFGDDAYHKNKDLVEGKMVRLEKDVSNSDKYGRWLRYVWLNEKMINEELVLQGFAQIATYPPDVRYHDRLLSAEGKARQDSLGLWSKCTQK